MPIDLPISSSLETGSGETILMQGGGGGGGEPMVSRRADSATPVRRLVEECRGFDFGTWS